MTAKSQTPGRSRAARAARGKTLVTVTLTPDTLEMLEAMADEDRVSRSDIANQAIGVLYRIKVYTESLGR